MRAGIPLSTLRLEDLLRGSVVHVVGDRGAGTGFFVAPGLIVTCAHVVADAGSLQVVLGRGSGTSAPAEVERLIVDRGRPLPSLDRDYPDLAILSTDADRHPCVAIDRDLPQPGDRFQAYGFPEEGGAVAVTPVGLEYRGIKGEPPTEFVDLAADTVREGMSGGPLFNLRTKAVGGILIATRSASSPEGGLAVPWATVADDLAELLAANAAFHAADGSWQALVGRTSTRVRFQLPLVTDHFVGREGELQQIEAGFRNRPASLAIQPIVGLGGVGKTQLAATAVRRRVDEYDVVAWIRADEGLLDLARLAVALGRADLGSGRQERAEWALSWLAETDSRWLLVLDNVQDPATLRELSPTAGRGDILVTTRHRGLADFGPPVSVVAFDVDEGCRYLLDRTGRDYEEDAAREVAGALGGLPLALSHAAAYCAAGTAFADYLDLLQNLPAQEVFETNLDAFYEQTVASTWQLSVSAAGAEAPLAPLALSVAAYLAPTEIPRSLFDRLTPEPSRPQGRKQVLDALAALHRYSLMDARGERIDVHRLLQKVTRDEAVASRDQRGRRVAIEALSQAFPVDTSPPTWPETDALLPHITALSRHPDPPTLIDERLVLLLLSACRHLERVVAGQEYVDLASTATETATNVLGPDSHVTLVVRATLVRAFHRVGLEQQAVELGARLLGDCERVLGRDHPETLRMRVIAAKSISPIGSPPEEIGTLRQIVADCDEVFGPDDQMTIHAKDHLATIYMFAGRYQEAVDLGEEAYRHQVSANGPEHPETIISLNNLATIYSSSPVGIERGIELSEEVLALRLRILGPTNPNTIAALTTLSSSYGRFGQLDKAIDFGVRAVEAWESASCERPETIAARVALGTAYLQANQLPEAVIQWERAVAESQRIFGPEHVETIAARATLASIYWKEQRHEEAVRESEAALKVARRTLPDEHPIREIIELTVEAVGAESPDTGATD